MQKSGNAILVPQDTYSSDNETEDSTSSPASTSSNDAETINKSSKKTKTSPDQISASVKLTAKGAVQLTSSNNATTEAILNLQKNPFYHDKRKWDDSFTVDEKKALEGNIVKAARDNTGGNTITLQAEEFVQPHYPSFEDDDQDSDDLDSVISKKPGRKPMPDEDNLSDPDQDPKIKRKAQNRAAQRAFRERKERYVKELEIKIKQVQDTNMVTTTQLVRENQQLRAIIYRLEMENAALKGIPFQPYQSELNSVPHYQPPLQPQQQRQSNYTNIAPLIPQSNPQSIILPAYPSTPTMTSAATTPSVQSPQPSVNQMMILPSSPLHQYPMSPVISNAIQNATNSIISSSPKKSIPKKVSAKQQKGTSNSSNSNNSNNSNNQPLEYTFAISTPASLRPSNQDASQSKQNSKSEPIELIQLYPPTSKKPYQPNEAQTKTEKVKPESTAVSPASSKHEQDIGSPLPTLQKSDLILLSTNNSINNVKKATSVASASSQSTCITTTNNNLNDFETSSVISTGSSSTHLKRVRQLELDLSDCHIDTEGQIFCRRLHNDVCNDAFDRLLSEPLFDQMGKLNLSIGPVPIVTGPMSFQPKEKENEKDDEEEDQQQENEVSEEVSEPVDTMSPNTINSDIQTKKKRLLNCQEIWFMLNHHKRFHEFTTDQLCQKVKEYAKCSDCGPVLEESDIVEILNEMDQGHF